MTEHDDSANERTLWAYERAASTYRDNLPPGPAPAVVAVLDRLAQALPAGASVLEIGSGPGVDADLLEARGLRVTRTDGTAAFVQMMREGGHDAYVLDVLHDDLGGPYDAVLANAVLLHLDRGELDGVLQRCAGAVRPGGMLAFSLKEGDGEEWHSRKLGLPRHFTYWREGPLRQVLAGTPWVVEDLRHEDGRYDRWLSVLARRS